MNMVLTPGILSILSFSAIASISTVNRHRGNPNFIRSRNCVPMVLTTESPPTLSEPAVFKVAWVMVHPIQFVQGITTNLVKGGAHSEDPADPNIVVRDNILFQVKGCPQAISEAEAFSRKSDRSLKGNVIKMTSQCMGRTGNHFVNISQFLAMGYCCKSKVLELPLEDGTFIGPAGDHFTSNNRFFDFSSADVMPLEEDHRLSELAQVCRPIIERGNKRAYGLAAIHPDLLSCMNRVYMRGCEAAYLGAMVDTSEFCADPEASGSGVNEAHFEEDVGDQLQEESKAADGPSLLGHFPGSGISAGSLAIHIRSGDIFSPAVDSRRYGQPPLSFYLKAIANKQWTDVSVLTFSASDKYINPTYIALEEMKLRGLLEPDVKFFKNRSFAADMETMLCADGLVFARSSLALMTSAHGRASYIYVPLACGPGTYTRRTRSRTSPKIVQDNTTLLAIEKPEAEIYGIEWNTGKTYTVYNSFYNSQRQRNEMVHFDGVKSLQLCRG